ncbi:MAG: sigma-70 family RNA polymerase sigma factor [Bacilli bacterium]|nr:sigma-70 family RNA polymerase sigma factor [Bacilli bacterium]
MLKRFLNYIKQLFNRCFFVGAADKLPPPLSKEVEQALLIKSKTGDQQAFNKLVEHNLRLVVYLAKRYENTGYDIEDLVSIGSIGLIKGINTYKLDKNIKLATYCSRCIGNEILMFLRKNKNKRAEVSLEDALKFDSEGNELHLEDILGSNEDLVEDEILHNYEINKLKKELLKIKGRDGQIIRMRYGINTPKEYTQKEVAEILGISQSYISRIEKKIIKNLKSLLN